MADQSAEDLKKAIKEILKGADLDNLSTKKVRKQLEQKFDADFTARKGEIDKLVMSMITENEEESDDEPSPKKKDKKDTSSDNEVSENDDQNGAASDEESGEEVPKKKAKKQPQPPKQPKGKRKSATKADDSEDPVMSSIKQMDDEVLAKQLQEEESGLRRRAVRRAAPQPKKERKKDKEKDPEKKKNSAYSRPCQLSEELAAVVGTNEMPRSDVVKTLWSIVKERNLQDPDNGQFMLCDAQMEGLFGVKRLRTFAMMKYLKKHIHDSPR